MQIWEIMSFYSLQKYILLFNDDNFYDGEKIIAR